MPEAARRGGRQVAAWLAACTVWGATPVGAAQPPLAALSPTGGGGAIEEPASDQPPERHSLADALRDGKFTLSFLLRYENVEQDGFDRPARASTLRTRLGYRSKPYHGFGLALEAEDVHGIGNDLHDNAGAGGLHNGVRDRPVIADPELTELDNAYLYYTGIQDTEIQVGRITLNLDNQRFVGAVGWRQNNQSFDGATATIEALQGWTFHYSFLDRQRAVTGADIDMEGHLAQAAYDSPIGKVVGYAYLLEFEEEPQARASSATFGARLTGSRELGRYILTYEAELGQQRDYARNTADYELGYRHLVLGGKRSGWAASAGWELLAGDGRNSLRTPLGTNHRFNGFADLFLVTPPDGLEDLYAQVSWAKKSWSSLVAYHRFEADRGGALYGTEWNLQVVYTTPWKQQLALKGAVHEARDLGADTTKAWAWTSWSF
jgi:hypothetical protein